MTDEPKNEAPTEVENGTIEWGNKKINPKEINFDYDEEGTWMGPWISLRPNDDYLIGFDPDELEYYAVDSVEALMEFVQLYNVFDRTFNDLRKRFIGRIYDFSGPFLYNYRAYLSNTYAPAQRELIKKYDIQRISWRFKKIES